MCGINLPEGGRMELTERQREILEFIYTHIREEGTPPTVREIGRRFSLTSTGSVRDHLSALVRKGYIEKIPGLSRGIRLVKEVFSDLYSIPIVGKIVAGEPELAVEDIEGRLIVDRKLAKSRKNFALRVSGDSMVEEGIMEGDYVVVRPQPAAEQGEIVVALIGDEATVKKFKRKGKSIKLLPANPSYSPIELTDDVTIVGKVIGVIRHY